MYCGYITTLKHVRAHPNADRMKLADCFGNTVCVGIDACEGDHVIYFPVDGQLSEEYCRINDLARRKDENGNACGGYLDPDKRNIRAIKLRGEKSDGITMPLESLAYTGVDINTLNVGDTITVVNGHDICQKYIPRTNPSRSHGGGGNRVRKRKEPIAPLFQEHADTEQLAYNLAAFKPGDEIEISLKIHGTSQRTAYLPVLQGYKDSWHCRLKNQIRFWIERVRKRVPLEVFMASLPHDGEPIYDYGYVSGTRRVVLDSYDGGFYGSNEFREPHAKIFEGKLWRNETVYYEVAGFTHTGAPIMASCDNKKLNDKEFVKQYGKETVFSYGCDCAEQAWREDRSQVPDKPESRIFVYRMTMTNPDGEVVEYTPDFIRYRCEQMGVEYVPVLWKGIIPEKEIFTGVSCEYTDSGDWVREMAEKFYDGPDPIGKTHVREGVVVRIVNRPKFTAYKHKNWSFKALEGIVKVEAEAPDMEEAQDEI